MQRLLAILAGLLALQVAAGATGGQVWVVGDHPTDDFVHPQSAIVAAADGDVILVRKSSPSPVVIAGKALSLIAIGGQQSIGSMVVRDLAPHQPVVVRGFRFGPAVVAVELVDNEGPVWLEKCNPHGLTSDMFESTGPGSALVATRSELVTLVDCDLTKDDSIQLAPWGPVDPTLHMVDSNLFVYGTTIAGPQGGVKEVFPFTGAFDGGDAVNIAGGSLWISGCTVTGGEGGVICTFLQGAGFCCHGANGGDGIQALDGIAKVRIQASLVTGGDATDTGAVDGLAFNLPGGFPAFFPGIDRPLFSDSPVRVGEPVAISSTGNPGDFAFALVSAGHDPAFRFELTGVQLVLEPFVVLPIGAAAADGSAAVTVPAPPLGAGLDGLTFYLQAVHLTAAPALALGGGSAVTLLGSGL